MSHKNVDMDGQKVALSIAVVILGLACFVLGTVAITIPHWGTFSNRVIQERGNFGPWTMCKELGFGRQICGKNISSFKPIFAVTVAGICATIGIAALGTYCLLSLLMVAMQVSRSHIICTYSHTVIAKLVVSIIAALFTLTAVALFATQGNDLEKGYVVEVAFSFYMEVVVAIFTLILMSLTVSEFWVARKTVGDPFGRGDTTDGAAGGAGGGGATGNHHAGQMGFGTTIGNPGFRDRPRANGISMTDSSVRFVPTSYRLNREKSSRKHGNNNEDSAGLWNGSVTSVSPYSNGSSVSGLSSVSTVSTVLSNSRGPLRSSLKKSRTTDGIGIPNPGFSGTSPTLSRTGSLKKVRIQTHSTDV